MTMTFTKAATAIVSLLLVAAPASAQQARPVRPPAAAPAPTPTPAPSAWTISTDEARGVVELSSVAKGGAAHFIGGCSRSSEPGFTGTFTQYGGDGLRRDGQTEYVAFYFRGEEWQDAFSVQLRYSAARQGWEIAKPISPVFVSSFSRAATLVVVNSRIQDVFSFDLTGSTAAARAMRTVCGYD